MAAIGMTHDGVRCPSPTSSPAIQSRPTAPMAIEIREPSTRTQAGGLRRRRRRHHGAEAVAQTEPAEPQPLLLGEQVDVLGAELLLQLALQIVEKVVPAHGATLVSRHAI